MAGIYLHIPFCKQACYYCDFHFSTSLNNKKDLLQSLVKEMSIRKNYLDGESIKTIYFGGGTPSLLSTDEMKMLMENLQINFNIESSAEITLEANPDDLDKAKFKGLLDAGINRLSIGVQSFFDEDLAFMNRAHNAQQAISSIKLAQDTGFENISIDLIYGTPTLSNQKWMQNIENTVELSVTHVSAYNLTVEEKTPLAHFIASGKIKALSDELGARHFEILTEEMKANGFVHYEISNFCKEGFYSRHNSSYWKKEKYIGLGPSAHSYDGESRQWNIANTPLYNKALHSGSLDFEKENLTEEQKYNEYILTTLRTIWGTDLKSMEKEFGNVFSDHCLQEAQKHLEEANLIMKENKLFLTEKGKLIADKISSDLFLV
jgi:oxygen-independent coproporphyrinogen III oxidase